MPRFAYPVLILGFLAITAVAAVAEVAATDAVPSLPAKAVDNAYRNGDLDSVVIYIKAGRNKPVFIDRNDSIVAFKYLGVIYAADPQNREKGRYYFNQLLQKDPRASITDLLPGEVARQVFKEVREEFFELNPQMAAQAGMPSAPSTGEPRIVIIESPAPGATSAGASDAAPAVPAASSAPAEPKPPRSYKWLWISGGVLATGAVGTAAVIALLDPPAKTYSLHD